MSRGSRCRLTATLSSCFRQDPPRPRSAREARQPIDFVPDSEGSCARRYPEGLSGGSHSSRRPSGDAGIHGVRSNGSSLGGFPVRILIATQAFPRQFFLAPAAGGGGQGAGGWLEGARTERAV